MICDWCGSETPDYASHFADPAFAGCRNAARRPEPHLVLLDPPLAVSTPAERAKIRGRARRHLYRSRHSDRTEALGLSTQRRR